MRVLLAIFLSCNIALAQAAVAQQPRGALSDAEEVRIGKLLAAKFIKNAGIDSTTQTTKIENYLQMVGDRLAAHAQRKVPYQFHFDPEPGFKSAMALPGGQIFVGGGVLAMMDTEDELATVLGHEMEHVELYQCRDRLAQELAAQHLTVETASQLNLEPFFASYGHDGELAADREGVKLAAEAGYSPEGAVRLLKLFLLVAEQSSSTPNGAKNSLHERITQLQSLIDTEKLAAPKERRLALP
jgi:predicted Zn-dependent protease